MDEAGPCGIVGSVLDSKDPARALLLSVWTAPNRRRRGVGGLLVNEIVRWATQRGARVLQFSVVSQNEPAILFYERLGFVQTGRIEPYRNDSTLVEIEMVRPITPVSIAGAP